MKSDRQLRAISDHHLAKVALASGRADIAQMHIQASLRNDPHNPEARLTQTKIQQPQNPTSPPATSLDGQAFEAPEKQTTLPVAILRARALAKAHRDHLAIPLLEQLIGQSPDDPSPRRLLASIHLRNKQPELAIKPLTQVVKLAPDDSQSLHILVNLLASTDPRACLDLMREHDLDFSTPQDQLQMARLHVRFEEPYNAEMIYRRLIARQPNDPQIQLEAGELALSMGAHALAIKRLTISMRATPTAGKSLAALALVYMNAGRFTQAGRFWWRATRVTPCDAQPWAGLLICAMHERRHTLQKRASDKLTTRTNKQTRRMVLAKLWPQAALGQIIRQAIRPSVFDQIPTASAMEMLLNHAANTLAQHAKKHPRRADTHYHLAVCQEALGDAFEGNKKTAEAIESIATALKINPQYTSAQAVHTRLLETAA